MSKIPFYPLMVLTLIGFGGYLGCDPDSIQLPLDLKLPTQTASNSPTYSASIPDRTASTILIGSFNMQRLGPSKLGKPWVIDKYVEIIRRFDVIALQEITSKDQTTLPQLIREINARGARYDFTISPRVGREASGYYEQYAFVYDTTRIQSGTRFSYLVQDGDDMLHREPWVGRFQTVGPQPFSFTLINVHTDPDEIKQELDVLADVYMNVRQFEYPEDDLMLMGDLNADPAKFQNLGRIPGVVPIVVGVATNAARSKTIDNILLDQHATREFTGRAGVVDMAEMFGISDDEAKKISDHMPIWGEFTISEQTGRATTMAGSAGPAIR